jgi:hypothetical protein
MKMPLHSKIVRVRHPEVAEPFSVSFRDCAGLMFCKAFRDGDPLPRKRTHLALTESVRAWLSELIEAEAV